MIKSLSGTEKATLLLSILGPQKAARILRHLPDEMANLLSAKVATLPPPDPDVVSEIYRELSNRALSAAKETPAIESSVEEVVEEEPVKEIKTDEEVLGDLADEIFEEEAQEEFTENIETKTTEHNRDSIMLVPTKNIVNVLKTENERVHNLFLLSIEEKKAEDVKTVLEIEAGIDISFKEVIETPILEKVRKVIVNEVIKKAEVI